LERIAVAVEHIDRKTRERRPRIIECAHPELHPVDAPFEEAL
jgi:hypothetical protein